MDIYKRDRNVLTRVGFVVILFACYLKAQASVSYFEPLFPSQIVQLWLADYNEFNQKQESTVVRKSLPTSEQSPDSSNKKTKQAILQEQSRFYVSVGDFLGYNFTVLAILVTMLSLLGVLSKEISQPLYRKYILENYHNQVCLFIYLAIFAVGLFEFNMKVFPLRFAVSISNLVLSAYFCWRTFSISNREYLYARIYDGFRKELGVYNNGQLVEFKSQDEFVHNLAHIQRTNQDTKPEQNFLEDVIKDILKTRIPIYSQKLEDIVSSKEMKEYRDVKYQQPTRIFVRIGEVISCKHLILFVLDKLHYHTYEKSQDIDLMLKLNEIFGTIVESCPEKRYFDQVPFYFKQLITFELEQKYKNYQNEKQTKELETLLKKILESLQNFITRSIGANIEYRIKRTYIENAITSLNSLATGIFYNPHQTLPYQEQVYSTQLHVALILISKIEDKQLSKGCIELAFKTFKIDGFKRYFCEADDIHENKFVNYDFVIGGSQWTKSKIWKYYMLICFWEYQRSEKKMLQEFSLRKFQLSKKSDWEYAINNLTFKYVSKFFECDKDKLAEFKIDAQKVIKNQYDKIDQAEKDKIIKSELDQGRIEMFKHYLLQRREDANKFREQYLRLKPRKDKSFVVSSEKCQYLKQAFIGDNVGFRDNQKEVDYQILNKLISHLNEEDKEISLTCLEKELKRRSGLYILLYNADLGDAFTKIPHISRMNRPAEWKFGKVIIRLIRCHIEKSILYKYGTFEFHYNDKDHYNPTVEPIPNSDEVTIDFDEHYKVERTGKNKVYIVTAGE